jgi:iron complex outermembrane receptor protein
MTALLLLLLGASPQTDSIRTVTASDLVFTGTKVDRTVPVTFTDITRQALRRVDQGKDLPLLLQSVPSLVSTSDAGMGVGYTGLRIRGSDETRINVTLNGIPLNDAESHGVFWVNMPDLASSVGSIQVQRGVGSSVNGPAAFGASVNIETAPPDGAPFAEAVGAAGSFNTVRQTLRVGTGRLGSGWALEGRLSRIVSDGFIDRASSDLGSSYLKAARYGRSGVFSVMWLSGAERTYQAWNGVPEARLKGDVAGMNAYADQNGLSDAERAHLLASGNRTYNAYTYEDQVDRYRQRHLHLHYRHALGGDWTAHIGLHRTLGAGYYEEFRAEERPERYGFAAGPRSDLIRRRWLDNVFQGVVAHVDHRTGVQSVQAGLAVNRYEGDHFGEVIWARGIPDADIRSRYYDNTGTKRDASAYAKWNREVAGFRVFADVQVRAVEYEFLGFDTNLNNVTQSAELLFVNPKAGLVRPVGAAGRAYASIAIGQKEPTRRDYTQSTPASRPKPERLTDLELGYRHETPDAAFGVNLYRMAYRDQLVLTGEVNDVGAYIRRNVDESTRTGLEVDGAVRLPFGLTAEANAALSRSRLPEYIEYLDDYDNGGQVAVRYTDTDISFSPRFTSFVGLRWERDAWSVSTRTQGVSRQYLDNTSRKSRSIDPYATTDISVDYSVGTSVSVQFTAFNLFDRAYESNGYTYGWIGGGEQRFNVYYPQAGRHWMMQVRVGL